MLGIEEELSVFLQAMLAGNIVFLVYCCLRVFRRIIGHGLFLISVEDFFFWIWTGLYLFGKIYDTSDGSIRWFFVAGVFAGGVCSCFVMRFFVKAAHRMRGNIRKKDEKVIEKSMKKR